MSKIINLVHKHPFWVLVLVIGLSSIIPQWEIRLAFVFGGLAGISALYYYENRSHKEQVDVMRSLIQGAGTGVDKAISTMYIEVEALRAVKKTLEEKLKAKNFKGLTKRQFVDLVAQAIELSKKSAHVTINGTKILFHGNTGIIELSTDGFKQSTSYKPITSTKVGILANKDIPTTPMVKSNNNTQYTDDDMSYINSMVDVDDYYNHQ